MVEPFVFRDANASGCDCTRQPFCQGLLQRLENEQCAENVQSALAVVQADGGWWSEEERTFCLIHSAQMKKSKP